MCDIDGAEVTAANSSHMPVYVFIFAALLAAALSYWLVHLRVRQILRERHPGVWLDLKAGSRTSLAATQWFALGRRDRDFDDQGLSRNCIALQTLTVTVWLLMAAYAVALFQSGWPRR